MTTARLHAQQYRLLTALRVLELRYENFTNQLLASPVEAVKVTQEEDVPALYWSGAAWGSALSVAKDDMALVGDLPIISALLERALELDESWKNGALHEFFIAFGGSNNYTAKEHFERAMQLNQSRSIAPLISAAESIYVKEQNRSEFERLLNQALSFDVESRPNNRLTNILAQKKTAFLLDNIDNLFF